MEDIQIDWSTPGSILVKYIYVKTLLEPDNETPSVSQFLTSIYQGDKQSRERQGMTLARMCRAWARFDIVSFISLGDSLFE